MDFTIRSFSSVLCPTIPVLRTPRPNFVEPFLHALPTAGWSRPLANVNSLLNVQAKFRPTKKTMMGVLVYDPES